MTFQWPEFLWLLAGLPLLVALYVYLLRRRKKFAVRYSSLALLKTAMAGGTWRRHVPPAILLVALGALIVAGARAQAGVARPPPPRAGGPPPGRPPAPRRPPSP